MCVSVYADGDDDDVKDEEVVCSRSAAVAASLFGN